jgi:hypothetical protein
VGEAEGECFSGLVQKGDGVLFHLTIFDSQWTDCERRSMAT